MLTERTFAAFLLDMDGTLVDSIAATNRIWTGWAERHGIDPDAVLRTMHGVRAVETIRRHLPQGDIEREAAVLTQAELADMEGVPEEIQTAVYDAVWCAALLTMEAYRIAHYRLWAKSMPP